MMPIASRALRLAPRRRLAVSWVASTPRRRLSTPKTACARGTCKRHRSTLGGVRSNASTPTLYWSGGFASTSRRMPSSTSGVDGPNRAASAAAAGESTEWCFSIGDAQADRQYDATAKKRANGIAIRTTRRRFLTAEASATPPAKSRNGSMRAKSVVVVHSHQLAPGYRPCGGQASTRSTLRPIQRINQDAMACRKARVQKRPSPGRVFNVSSMFLEFGGTLCAPADRSGQHDFRQGDDRHEI